jgi:hypothetical protein
MRLRKPFYDLVRLDFDNIVSLYCLEKEGEVAMQHYGSLIEEGDFEALSARIQEANLPYWA